MILTKYILKEIFKNQLIILIILVLVCICQKLIKLVGLDHHISIYSILLYLVLNIPELIKLIIPFSVFLSVIITFYRLHIHNEILIMYSCGINKSFFIQKILLYSLTVTLIAFINLSWLSPYCIQYQYHILFEIKKNIYSNKLSEKKFYFFSDKTLVLFIDNIYNTTFQNVCIIKKRKNKNQNTFSILIAQEGNLYHNHKILKSFVLKSGTYFEIPYNQTINSNIYVTNFSQYHIPLDYQSNMPLNIIHNTVDNMSINQLWRSSTTAAQIEFNWRLTLLISICILPIIAVLFMAEISYNYLPSFILAIIVYTFFFLLQILLKSYTILHGVQHIVWMWLINFIYFIITLLSNIWEKALIKKFFKRFYVYLKI